MIPSFVRVLHPQGQIPVGYETTHYRWVLEMEKSWTRTFYMRLLEIFMPTSFLHDCTMEHELDQAGFTLGNDACQHPCLQAEVSCSLLNDEGVACGI